MFVGVSKNIGNGFRVGLGTKIGGKKKGTNKELNTKEFQQFLSKVEEDLQLTVITFIEANGYNYKDVTKGKSTFNEDMQDNQLYQEFVKLTNEVSLNIEKILYTGDSGVIAKRHITEDVFKVKAFINEHYPNYKTKAKTGNNKGMPIWKKILLFLIVLTIINTIIEVKYPTKISEEVNKKEVSNQK